MIEIAIRTQEQVRIVELAGRLDAQAIPEIETQLEPIICPDCALLLDLQQVNFMSSAGLRLLLLLDREITNQHGKIVLVGLSERLEDTMLVTGFLTHFEHYRTLDAGLKALRS